MPYMFGWLSRLICWNTVSLDGDIRPWSPPFREDHCRCQTYIIHPGKHWGLAFGSSPVVLLLNFAQVFYISAGIWSALCSVTSHPQGEMEISPRKYSPQKHIGLQRLSHLASVENSKLSFQEWLYVKKSTFAGIFLNNWCSLLRWVT